MSGVRVGAGSALAEEPGFCGGGLQEVAGALLIGSSNFSETGFLKNIEWDYFTPGKAGSLPGNDDPFPVGCRAFEGYWSSQAVDVTDDFLSAYRRRWQKQQDSTGGQRAGEGVFEKASSWNAWGQPRVLPNAPQREALENISSLRNKGIGKLAVIAATGTGNYVKLALM